MQHRFAYGEDLTGKTVNGTKVIERVPDHGRMRWYLCKIPCGCVKPVAAVHIGKRQKCQACHFRSLVNPDAWKAILPFADDYKKDKISAKEIASTLGICHGRVIEWLSKAGAVSRRRRCLKRCKTSDRLKANLAAVQDGSDSRWLKIVRMYVEEAKSIGIIAEELGVSKQRIQQIISKFGSDGLVVPNPRIRHERPYLSKGTKSSRLPKSLVAEVSALWW